MGAYASLQPLLTPSKTYLFSPHHYIPPSPPTCTFFPFPATDFIDTSTVLTMAAKKRCQFQINTDAQCSSAALRIVGECPHCRAQFCSSHRLPEHHNCSKLEDCRQQAFDRNKNKLESERTVAPKMATA